MPLPPSADDRLVVGCMTGTSLDALDVALISIRGRGLAMHATFLRGRSADLGPLGPRLRSLADQEPMTAGDIASLSREFAILHAVVVRETLGDRTAALVAVHGQTVFHAPPLSWQMFNGPILARELGVPVVFDLRAADLAAGGQGAPITPLADWILFRADQPRAIVNLGGFCNATLLPAVDPATDAAAQIACIEGFDVCACNHVLDRVARDALGVSFDSGGARALGGQVSSAAARELGALLGNQSAGGRSLGTGDETALWVDRWHAKMTSEDLAATACAAIGATIAARIGRAAEALLAGGGARNAALAGAISAGFEGPVRTTADAGIPIEFREAAAMAVLGALCADGIPITLPRVTGVPAPAPIAGVWAGVHPPTLAVRTRP